MGLRGSLALFLGQTESRALAGGGCPLVAAKANHIQHLEPTSKSPGGWGQSLSRPGESRSLLSLILLSTAQAFFRESYGLGLAASSSRLSLSLAIPPHTSPSFPLHLEGSSPTPLYPFSPFPNSEHLLPFPGAHLRGLPSHVSLPPLLSCLHLVSMPLPLT